VNTHANALFFFIHTDKQLLAQRTGNGFNLFDQRACGITQDNFFGAAVFQHGMTLDQPLGLKAVKQTSERRPFNANA